MSKSAERSKKSTGEGKTLQLGSKYAQEKPGQFLYELQNLARKEVGNREFSLVGKERPMSKNKL